jgi:lipoprotein-releasing system permease protein
VTSKVKDIGILKSIGVSSRGIKNIFTLEGLSIGIAGTFLGVVSGVVLCLLLKRYQFIQLPPEIYYITKLPVAIEWRDIAVIVAAAILISFLSTIYPASKAAKLNPVEALRYE